ncbi:MAG: hypothetical protein ACREQO_27565 [Candidatus Binatia bacterium]
MAAKPTNDRRLADLKFKELVLSGQKSQARQHQQNLKRFEGIEGRLSAIESVRSTLEALHKILETIQEKIDKFEPNIFKKIVAEHESREVIRKWLARCFSTTTRILITVSALVAAIGTVAGAWSYVLNHFH